MYMSSYQINSNYIRQLRPFKLKLELGLILEISADSKLDLYLKTPSKKGVKTMKFNSEKHIRVKV